MLKPGSRSWLLVAGLALLSLAWLVSDPPSAAPDEPAHYFRMMKELALLGYFTSEIGYTKVMRYRESPGRFDPCAPHAPGDKIWASHA